MEKRFVRVRSIKDVVVFLSLIIIGVFLVLFPDVEAAYLGGWTLILIGVVTGLVMKSAYKDVETGEVFLKRELLYSARKNRMATPNACRGSPKSPVPRHT